MASNQTSDSMQAIVLSFPLNFRKITDKLHADIESINLVSSSQVFGSNMRLLNGSTTCVKLYLPNFSEKGFSTKFFVSGNIPKERLARSINVYGLAASFQKFCFIHYISNSHLIVCISIECPKESEDYQNAVLMLNYLHDFLQFPIKSN